MVDKAPRRAPVRRAPALAAPVLALAVLAGVLGHFGASIDAGIGGVTITIGRPLAADAAPAVLAVDRLPGCERVPYRLDVVGLNGARRFRPVPCTVVAGDGA